MAILVCQGHTQLMCNLSELKNIFPARIHEFSRVVWRIIRSCLHTPLRISVKSGRFDSDPSRSDWIPGRSVKCFIRSGVEHANDLSAVVVTAVLTAVVSCFPKDFTSKILRTGNIGNICKSFGAKIHLQHSCWISFGKAID